MQALHWRALGLFSSLCFPDRTNTFSCWVTLKWDAKEPPHQMWKPFRTNIHQSTRPLFIYFLPLSLQQFNRLLECLPAFSVLCSLHFFSPRVLLPLTSGWENQPGLFFSLDSGTVFLHFHPFRQQTVSSSNPSLCICSLRKWWCATRKELPLLSLHGAFWCLSNATWELLCWAKEHDQVHFEEVKMLREAEMN